MRRLDFVRAGGVEDGGGGMEGQRGGGAEGERLCGGGGGGEGVEGVEAKTHGKTKKSGPLWGPL